MPNACGREFAKRDDKIEHCSYCGSISVADAIKFLKMHGTRFSGSDWKYGYPHKFYIEPPNPNAKDLVEVSSKSGPDVTARNGSGPNDKWRCFAHGSQPCSCPKEQATGYWYEVSFGTRSHLYCKFYTKHIADGTPEQQKEFDEISKKVFGIHFEIKEDNKLYYSAPKTYSFYGYQRAGVIGENGEPVHTF